MKNLSRILSLVVVLSLVLSFALIGTCFADTEGGVDTTGTETFKLISSYPEDGAVETSVENMGIKLYFNKHMTAEVLGESNAENFTLTDEDNTQLPIKVLYAPKEDGVVLVLLDTAHLPEGYKIASPGVFKFTISKDVVDDDGDVLGTNKVISFTTQNQTRNGLVNTALMIVMTVGMVFFTMKSQKKSGEEDAKKDPKAKQSGTVNPYKEAKKTGKSVEEIVQKDQQRKDKEALKAQKEADKEAKLYAEYGLLTDDELLEEYMEEGHYKVGKPRTVASAGSTYITGRKAEYEAMLERKAKEAKWAAEAKKKGKGKKKK